MKIPVEFEANFESDGLCPIHVGRLMIGPHVMRLYFYPDGYVKGVISETAKTDGSLIFNSILPAILGFPKDKINEQKP